LGCCAGSAISAKIVAASAATTRSADTILSSVTVQNLLAGWAGPTRGCAGLTSDPAALPGKAGGFVPVGGAEFGDSSREIVADSASRQVRTTGNLLNRGALGSQGEHIGLAGGERRVTCRHGLGSQLRV